MAGPVGRKLLGVAQLIAAVGVAGVLIAAVLLPFTGGLGLAARNSVQAFDEQPCDVEVGTPDETSTMFAADGTTIATFYAQKRDVVAAKDIPKVMRQAIIAIEDRRFLEHHGVDPEALLRAVVKNQQAGETVQGGSTLTHAIHQERPALPGDDARGAEGGDRPEHRAEADRGPLRAGAGEQAHQGRGSSPTT